VESGTQVVVGVNRFGDSKAPSPAIFRSDPGVEEQRRKALERLRAGRDGGAVARSLQRLEEAARGGEPLMPAILGSVKAYATLGEICNALRAVYGEYQPPVAI
ncbi:MAG: methylmalonyl-CoA mutase, partial [Chloroflexi bacterium]|nr:methylmalonyl-CoA mutase [Chloroflexota bacterium]